MASSGRSRSSSSLCLQLTEEEQSLERRRRNDRRTIIREMRWFRRRTKSKANDDYWAGATPLKIYMYNCLGSIRSSGVRRWMRRARLDIGFHCNGICFPISMELLRYVSKYEKNFWFECYVWVEIFANFLSKYDKNSCKLLISMMFFINTSMWKACAIQIFNHRFQIQI